MLQTSFYTSVGDITNCQLANNLTHRRYIPNYEVLLQNAQMQVKVRFSPGVPAQYCDYSIFMDS